MGSFDKAFQRSFSQSFSNSADSVLADFLRRRKEEEDKERQATALTRFVEDLAELKALPIETATAPSSPAPTPGAGGIESDLSFLTDTPAGLGDNPREFQKQTRKALVRRMLSNFGATGLPVTGKLVDSLSSAIHAPEAIANEIDAIQPFLSSIEDPESRRVIEQMLSSGDPTRITEGINLVSEIVTGNTKTRETALNKLGTDLKIAQDPRSGVLSKRMGQLEAIAQNEVIKGTSQARISHNVENARRVGAVEDKLIRDRAIWKQGLLEEKAIKENEVKVEIAKRKTKVQELEQGLAQYVKDKTETLERIKKTEETNFEFPELINGTIKFDSGSELSVAGIYNSAVGRGASDQEIIDGLSANPNIDFDKGNPKDVRKVVGVLNQVRQRTSTMGAKKTKDFAQYIFDHVQVPNLENKISEVKAEAIIVNNELVELGEVGIKLTQPNFSDPSLSFGTTKKSADVATKSDVDLKVDEFSGLFNKVFGNVPESQKLGTGEGIIDPLKETVIDAVSGFGATPEQQEEIRLQLLESVEQAEVLQQPIIDDAVLFDTAYNSAINAGVDPEDAFVNLTLHPPEQGAVQNELKRKQNELERRQVDLLLDNEAFVDSVLPEFVIDNKYDPDTQEGLGFVSSSIRDTLLAIKKAPRSQTTSNPTRLAEGIREKLETENVILAPEDFKSLERAINRMINLDS